MRTGAGDRRRQAPPGEGPHARIGDHNGDDGDDGYNCDSGYLRSRSRGALGVSQLQLQRLGRLRGGLRDGERRIRRAMDGGAALGGDPLPRLLLLHVVDAVVDTRRPLRAVLARFSTLGFLGDRVPARRGRSGGRWGASMHGAMGGLA